MAMSIGISQTGQMMSGLVNHTLAGLLGLNVLIMQESLVQMGKMKSNGQPKFQSATDFLGTQAGFLQLHMKWSLLNVSICDR